MTPHPFDALLFTGIGAATALAVRYLYRVEQDHRRERSKRNHPTHKPGRINR